MKKKKRYSTLWALVTMLFFVPYSSYAQKDSAYIKPFQQNLSVKTFISKMFTVVGYKDESGNEIEYKPNSPLNIGLGFSYKRVGLSGSFGIKLPSERSKGKTKAFEFQYHFYGQKFMFDLFFHKYKGFYIDNDDDNDEFVHRPDIRLLQLGVFGQYVFNGDKYSSDAAFNQGERQYRSAGSFLVGSGVFYNRVRADSTLSRNTSLLSQTYINNAQIGVSVGYAHTWAIRRFHIAAAIAVGCNIGVIDINSYKANGVDVYPSVFPRIAVGYNAKSWSINAQFITNVLYTTFSSGNQMYLSTGNGQLTFIKRF